MLGIAGEKIAVTTFDASVKRFCEGYLCEGEPTVFVSVSPDDVEAEREISKENGYPNAKDAELSHLALYRKIACALLDKNVLLFHGSALSMNGQAVLFAAKSGTGKSTHARLWREAYGDRVLMINDDKPLLKFTENEILVCGTPWNGKHRLGTNVMIPLKALCVLRRGEKNEIGSVRRADVYVDVLKQIYSPPDPAAAVKVFSLTDRLTKEAELYTLYCNMEKEAARVSHDAIFEKEKDKP